MIAVVVVRDGVLPLGAEEAINEAAGRVLLVGSGTQAADTELVGATSEVTSFEAGNYRPAAWAVALADELRVARRRHSPGFGRWA